MSRTSAVAAAVALWLGTAVPRPWWWAMIGVAVLVASGVVGRAGPSPVDEPEPSWSRLMLVLLALGVAGAGLSGARVAMRDHGPLSLAVGKAEQVEAVVVSEPRTTAFGSWAVVRVERFGPSRVRERALLRMPEPPQIGARLRLRGRVQALPDGPFSAYLRSQGVGWQLGPTRAPVTVGDPRAVLRVTSHVRDRLRAVAWDALPPDQASLLTGLVTGDARGRPSDVNNVLTAAGLRHLVVVSGRHTALFLAGVMGLAMLLRLPFRATRLVTLAALAWFVVLVRWQPSVLRAATVAGILLVADLLGRDRDHVHLLAIAVMLLLLIDPLLGRQLGFVLSVAATAGVLIVAPMVYTHVRGPPWWRVGLSAAVGAQLAVAPVLFAQDEAVPVAGIFANLVAAPAAALAQMIGSMVALVGLGSPGAAEVIANLARVPLGVVLWTARRAAQAPAIDGLGDPLAVATLLLVAGAMSATVVRRLSPRRWVGGAFPVTAAIVIVAVVVAFRFGGTSSVLDAPVDALTVTVLDVGQGDAVLVEAPDGDGVARMLVDGGPDADAVADRLRDNGVNALDVVVLSHAHHDHSAGLPAVLTRVNTGVLVTGPRFPHDDEPPSALAAIVAARGRGTPVVTVSAGTGFKLGEAYVTVLGPIRDVARWQTNDRSVVLRIDGPTGSALLPGDAEELSQQRLLRHPENIDVDLLKVPHHGGATNARRFLAATDPVVAVISAGEDNDYGHPSPQVLRELLPRRTWRTDVHGEIRVELGPGGPSVTHS